MFALFHGFGKATVVKVFMQVSVLAVEGGFCCRVIRRVKKKKHVIAFLLYDVLKIIVGDGCVFDDFCELFQSVNATFGESAAKCLFAISTAFAGA